MHVLVAYDIRRVALCIKIQHAIQMITTVSIQFGTVFCYIVREVIYVRESQKLSIKT